MDKYRIALPGEERTGLEQWVSGGKSAARRLTQARILRLADEWQGQACAETEIGSALGGSLRTIERVRKRLVTEGCAAALEHRPHPPRRTRASSRATWNRSDSNWPVVSRPAVGVSGRYNCSSMSWSCWVWSLPSAP
jgi:hypothetical protein